MIVEERSNEKITINDLKQLRDLALEDLQDFFNRCQRYKPYRTSLILIALCQGAALHYLDGYTGVKDFDVWSFFTEIPTVRFPYRRLKKVESGLVKFGVHPLYFRWNYKSRHVDLLMRRFRTDIVKRNRGDPQGCITEYLTRGGTKSARELAKKAVIGLYPDVILGKVLYSCKKIAR